MDEQFDLSYVHTAFEHQDDFLRVDAKALTVPTD